MGTKLMKIVSLSMAILLASGLVYAFVVNRPSPPSDDRPESVGRSSGRPSTPDLLFEGVSVEGREGGERVWMLKAARVEAGASDGRVEMYDITNGEIYRDEKPYLTFSAGRGVHDRRTGQLRLDRGVKVRSGGKDLIVADEVLWDPKQSKVTIPGRTEIASSSGTVTVDQLEVDVGSDKIYSAGDLIISEVEGRPGVRVNSDNICFSSDGESFEARGETIIQFEVDDSEE